jgi:hypothetical protein
MLTGKQGSESVKAIHAICHRINGEPQNLRKIDTRNGIYGSGWWKVRSEDADALVGGGIYLHESSKARSHFLGKIQSLGDPRHDGRIEFIDVKQPTIRDQPWRGPTPGQSPDQYFRIVEADYPHETGGAS